MSKKVEIKVESIFNTVFQQELINSSDRACVILGGAGLDVALYNLLKKFFINDKIVEELIGVNNGNAPLGTFSSKVKVAYCLGLISEDNYRDLQYVRKIRNIFAHKLQGFSFETNQIKSWVGNLIFIKQLNAKNSGKHIFPIKTQFIISIYQLGGQIESNTKSVKHINKLGNSILS